MVSPSSLSVVLVAAGQGERLGSSVPKAFVLVAGQSLLERTVETLIAVAGISASRIQIVIDPAHASYFAKLSHLPEGLPAPVSGGRTRGESVLSGLDALGLESHALADDEIILVHDAARPFVTKPIITDLCAAMTRHKAAIPTVPLSDALKRREGLSPVKREEFTSAQTPQAFHAQALRRARQYAPRHGYPDEAAWVQAAGVEVQAIKGDEKNFKITHAEDWLRAEAMLSETVYGSGFDLHRYDEPSGKEEKIAVGGVLLPHQRPVIGHSDGDVVLHALVDALLGSVAAGDIGQHFPPSDPQWRGADSRVFLDFALKKLTDARAQLRHVDVTIIADTPKISPHRQRLQKRLRELLNLEAGQVGVKATTSEGLGFIDAKHAIAAQVMVSVVRPVRRRFAKS